VFWFSEKGERAMKHKQFTAALTSALCVTALSGPAVAVDGPVFTGIGDLPGGEFMSHADAVSGDGNTVVGWGSLDDGYEALRWRWDDGIEGLGDLPGGAHLSYARGVSEDGSVVVGQSDSTFQSDEGIWAGQEAFRWTVEEGMVGLGDLPDYPFGSRAEDVSADGRVITGTADFRTGEGSEGDSGEAFLWTEEIGMVGLGSLSGPTRGAVSVGEGISADGTMVAGYGGAPSQEAFRWTESTGMIGLGDLPGGKFFSFARAISADGNAIIGFSGSDDGSGGVGVAESFRWTEATGMVGLGDLPGGAYLSYAQGVSGDGTVIVGNSETDGGLEPFVWTDSHGMRRLADVLSDVYGLDFIGWQLLRVWDVSDDGLVMVGTGTNPEGNQEGWVVCLRDECFEEDDDDDDHGGKGHRHYGDKGKGHQHHDDDDDDD
jgi:probable HAF family extracellular repeat protein